MQKIIPSRQDWARALVNSSLSNDVYVYLKTIFPIRRTTTVANVDITATKDARGLRGNPSQLNFRIRLLITNCIRKKKKKLGLSCIEEWANPYTIINVVRNVIVKTEDSVARLNLEQVYRRRSRHKQKVMAIYCEPVIGMVCNNQFGNTRSLQRY